MTNYTISTAYTPALFYRRTGTGPAIVLIHGFPATGALWNEVIPVLSQSFTVLVPDLPGTGSSRLDGETSSMDELAACINAMLQDAGIKRTLIAGHSMGGYVALAFGKQYPEATAGIALIHSTAAADDPEKKQLRQKTISLLRKGGKEMFVKSFIPTLFGNDFKSSSPDKVKDQESIGNSVSVSTMIAFYTAMMERSDSQEFLTNALFPVQWIMGRRDEVVKPKHVMQQTYRPAVSFVHIYPEVGHMGMLEAPSALAMDVTTFGKYCFRSESSSQES